MTNVSIPLPLAILTAAALAWTAALHVLDTAFLLRATGKHVNLAHPQFPSPIQPAVLNVTNARRFWLHSNDSDWDSLLPSGAGFIYHPGHKAHFLVSHYHQLHCLRSLREYTLLLPNLTKSDYGHVDHCLIYLRQMFMCNLDLTMEPPEYVANGTRVVTGIGVEHQCRDWAQLWDYMEHNYDEWKDTYAS